MIQAINLSYQAGERYLVNSVGFTATQGQVTAIIGANGAGKSTLLKMICGEMKPSAGNILLDGKLICNYTPLEMARKRAILTQQQSVSLPFSVHEVVLMGRYPHFTREPSEKDLAIIDKAMARTGIAELAGRAYHTLSGGEQQRVQLARVISQIMDVDGGWLLLDEPTNGLDLLHQQQLMQQARQMADDGFGVICILHDLNLAAAFADKILLLKNGQLLAAGLPKEVMNVDLIYNAFGIHIQLIENQHLPYPLIVNSGLTNSTAEKNGNYTKHQRAMGLVTTGAA